MALDFDRICMSRLGNQRLFFCALRTKIDQHHAAETVIAVNFNPVDPARLIDRVLIFQLLSADLNPSVIAQTCP